MDALRVALQLRFFNSGGHSTPPKFYTLGCYTIEDSKNSGGHSTPPKFYTSGCYTIEDSKNVISTKFTSAMLN